MNLTLLSVTVTACNRPKSIVSVDILCPAEFAALYYKDYKIPSDETNDAETDILTDEIAEL